MGAPFPPCAAILFRSGEMCLASQEPNDENTDRLDFARNNYARRNIFPEPIGVSSNAKQKPGMHFWNAIVFANSNPHARAHCIRLLEMVNVLAQIKQQNLKIVGIIM